MNKSKRIKRLIFMIALDCFCYVTGILGYIIKSSIMMKMGIYGLLITGFPITVFIAFKNSLENVNER